MSSKNLRKKAKKKWHQQIVDEQEFRCHLCGHRHQLTLHHLIALEDGGENARENLIGLCRSCHLFWHGIGTGCRDSAWEPLNGLQITKMAGVVEPTHVFPRRKNIRSISEKRGWTEDKIYMSPL